MSYSYNTRFRGSKSSQCIFRCCGNRTLKQSGTGNALTKLKCKECSSSWHDMCLFESFGIILSKAYALNNNGDWVCPNCFDDAYEERPSQPPIKRHKGDGKDDKSNKKSFASTDSDSDIDYAMSTSNKKIVKKSHKKSSKKKKLRLYQLASPSESSSSDIDAYKSYKKKKLTKKLKKKRKSIKNRLKNIDAKHGLKYDEKMLQVNDSGTDFEFDAANYYPDKAPQSETQLENLREKKAKQLGGEYVATKKPISRYRKFERDAIIEIIEDIADDPLKYDYSPRFGWCRTDIAVLVRDYLYGLRKLTPAKYHDIPYRNCAAIISKFIWWEQTANKESKTEKNYIGRYESAKNKINKNALKGTTSANDTLTEFGRRRTEDKLKSAQKKIKTLKTDCNMKESITGAVTSLVGIMKDFANDKEKKVESEAKDVMAHSENCTAPSTNPYVDNSLMDKLTPYSPTNNQRYLANHGVNVGNKTAPKPSMEAISNMIMATDKCLKFITKFNITSNSPYDEVNEKKKSDIHCIEQILFDDHKCHKLAHKYTALTDPILELPDAIILNQLALTAKILL